jgi:hypothetical protein
MIACAFVHPEASEFHLGLQGHSMGV